MSEIYLVINPYSMESVEIVSDYLKWIFEMARRFLNLIGAIIYSLCIVER